MSAPIPVHVFTGPLGCGKTTAILNYLERHAAGENTAVIVNDFGKAGLDAEVLGAAGAELEVRNIAGGCLCCSSKFDMRDAIEAVLTREGLTRIIIEPSGLVVMSDFAPYLKRLCEEFGLDLRPIIALLNPKRTKESHYKALPFFSTLVDNADVLVANRIDQCTEAQLAHFREWTARLQPAKQQIVETSFGELPEEIFTASREPAPAMLKFYAPHRHEESSGGISLSLKPVSEATFQAAMRRWIRDGLNGAQVLRFKATLPTENGWRLFEVADGSDYVREMPAGESAKLDWISLGEIPDEVMRAELLAAEA